MNPHRLSPYERALDACIGDDAERRVCEWVAQWIEERRTQPRLSKANRDNFYEVLPEVIFRELNSVDESNYSKIFNALHKMSMHSIGMLETKYEWYEDTDDILGNPVSLEGSEVAEALRSGMMYSPVSGERIPDFSNHVHIVYIARTDKSPYQVAEE